ncbi:hypothetical protein GH714_042220 [Hevea brasiliensis]|uniref:Kinesin motor domain-containing protein n=1 Tax=Hevea brasiliensis TaxID=3981 RepID=A0A6A6MYG9_HEVBR|nr:hypothetical protein GH714_042220 [Hevea brasiliensis]
MDDPTVELILGNCNHTIPICDSKPNLSSFSEIDEETANSMSEDSASSRNQETSLKGPTLPILQKIINLSYQIQNLKKEHAILSNQVKTVSTDSFPGPEVLDTLQLLSNEYELLKKKYQEESSERRRLYNEVIELKGNIRVFCRCRPLNQVEIASDCNCVVEFDSSLDNELHIISSDSSKKQFKFDHVFRPEDNQEAVFAQTKPIVTSVLDGYNVCIFAYGQTGTGKTFTMEGTPENRGVNYRTLEELFRISQERSGVLRYELFVSMLEVYNEKIRDLLVENSNQPPKKLEIKQAAEGTQEVPGLIEARVYGTEEVWELLKSGSRARSVGSTSANELSSRSHWNSKLTHMLQSSLGGDCKTLMFVQISPSAADLGETLCSLNFASRVRGIETGPARKQADFTELFKYKQMAEKLQHDEKETKKLQENLQSMQLRLAAREHKCRSLQEKVRELENLLGEERKTRLKQETKAFAASSQSSLPSLKRAAEKTRVDRKPPLGPSKLRLPLRRITNFIPPTSPAHTKKTKNTASMVPSSVQDKENIARTAMAGRDTKSLLQPRRISIAVRPSTTMTTSAQVRQPKRRVSIATFQPDPNSNLRTPLHTSASRLKSSGAVGRQSFMKDPRKARYSRLFSPLPELQSASETTPTAMRISSKFIGSPPTQAGSWKPRHPTVVALQRKALVWSPLKLRGMKNYRKSLLPSQPLAEIIQ